MADPKFDYEIKSDLLPRPGAEAWEFDVEWFIGGESRGLERLMVSRATKESVLAEVERRALQIANELQPREIPADVTALRNVRATVDLAQVRSERE